jgi:hypothetical protein
MNNKCEPADAEPSAPPVATKRSRRRRVAALLNANALLATTALITAIEPKSPPFKGD